MALSEQENQPTTMAPEGSGGETQKLALTSDAALVEAEAEAEVATTSAAESTQVRRHNALVRSISDHYLVAGADKAAQTTTKPSIESGDRENDDGDDAFSDLESSEFVKASGEGPCSKGTSSVTSENGHRVRNFRWFVVGMLIMTAVVTGIAYRLLQDEEERIFYAAYDQFSGSLADAALNQQRALRDSMASLANEITAYAQSSSDENVTWPFVRLPLFESYAKGYFDHSAGELVAVNNIIYDKDRDQFVNWTTAHYQDWIADSHMIRYGNLDKLNQDPARYNPFISTKTSQGFVPDSIRDIYHVRTSQSPPMSAYGPLTNLNVASFDNNEGIVNAVLTLYDQTCVTEIKPFNALPPEVHATFHDAEKESDTAVDHPHSFMFHPVYETVQNNKSNNNNNNNQESGPAIVATITSSVAWDASMRNLLPETVKDIHCVVTNGKCGQTFTYKVVGRDAIYLGDGDLHDEEYDNFEVRVNLSMHTHADFESTPGHCQYVMSIYPTDDFKNDYVTNVPMFFTVIVAASFALVAIVFFAYDFLAQRRNQELAKSAAKSNKLVSSLFPVAIKDRLLDLQEDSIRGTHSRTSTTLKQRISNNSKSQEKLQKQQEDEQAEAAATAAKRDSAPLAMVYENTTVMFADLSGFTLWSSTRTPEDVFRFLETLYSTFDNLARKYAVFKVETIGDCYVAATGLPEPQSDHAVRMVRFVNECMKGMHTVITDLVESMGEDTANLQLRAGLHSGAVTGGVLRGDKARFQLYGDTMNTASRMESSGIPARIHVSQDTADALAEQGKGCWCHAREATINPKGKGEMQTYWVQATGRAFSTAMSARSSEPEIICDEGEAVESSHHSA